MFNPQAAHTPQYMLHTPACSSSWRLTSVWTWGRNWPPHWVQSTAVHTHSRVECKQNHYTKYIEQNTYNTKLETAASKTSQSKGIELIWQLICLPDPDADLPLSAMLSQENSPDNKTSTFFLDIDFVISNIFNITDTHNVLRVCTYHCKLRSC